MRPAHSVERLSRCFVAVVFAAAITAPQTVSAQDGIADFFRGKRVTIVVGSAAGSGYDFGARILARHLSRHIPGNPSIIVQNMPGGGGRTVASFLNSVAPRDGTVIAAIQSFLAVDPLFDSSKSATHFDPRQFTWIGSIANSTGVAVAWHTSAVKTYQDLFTKELVVGGVGAGTPMVTFPYLFNRLLGMKFKVVSGYLASPEVDLAMERGEVEGRATSSWHSLRHSRIDWVNDGKLRILFQIGLQKHPELMNVPLIIDLARTEEERRILEVAFMSYEFGRAIVAPPNLPDNRKAALRKAFGDTMNDKAFLDEAEQLQLEVNPVSGERLESLVHEMYSLPPSLVARAKALQDPTGATEVRYKTVRVRIGDRAPNEQLAIDLLDGGKETIVVGDRVAVTIARTKMTVDALKPGMMCAVAYLGPGTAAKSIDCD